VCECGESVKANEEHGEAQGCHCPAVNYALSRFPVGTKEAPITVSVLFTCELQVDNREQFQKDGHMLFSLYRKNPNPDMPDALRQWEGENVYALRLMYKGQQVHRVMSDSLEDATSLMEEGLRNFFFALFTAQFIQEFDRLQFDKMHQERSQFAEWIANSFKKEIEAGIFKQVENPFELAASLIQYYRKEK
jgi:hypothetical protein